MTDFLPLISSPPALAKPFRNSLRNANINYWCGRFFVTVQVEYNKSHFGAVEGGGEWSAGNKVAEGFGRPWMGGHGAGGWKE